MRRSVRLAFAAGLALVGLIFVFVPGAAGGAALVEAHKHGGTDLWFSLLAAAACLQLVVLYIERRHAPGPWPNIIALYAQAAALALLAMWLVLGAKDLHDTGKGWQGLGGATLWATLAIGHIVEATLTFRDHVRR